MDSDQIRREDCRLATLAALHARPTGAFEASTIRSLFLKGYGFDLAEVQAALTFLVDAGFVRAIPEALGATDSYQITAQGTLHKERHAR